MKIPDWWEFALLATAAWRTFQLLSADDLLETPRRHVTRRLSEKWQDFAECPYCFGAWIAGAYWLAWEIWPHGTLVVSTPMALSAGVIAAAKMLSFDE